MNRSRAITALIFAGAIARPAIAATFDVDTTVDSADVAFQACTAAANDCSLRGAIIMTNALAGSDTVRVPAGIYALTIVGGDDVGLVGDLDVTDALVVQGQGTGATIDGTAIAENVFHLLAAPGTNVRLGKLTITGGAVMPGGAVYVQSGTAVISNCTLSGNDVGTGNFGGAVYNLANLTIRATVIEDNHSSLYGGGIYNATTGVLEVLDSTVDGNTGDWSGGGLYNVGTAVVRRSSISGNTAGQIGGGVTNQGTLTLRNVTVDANISNGAGGVPLGSAGIFNDQNATATIVGGSVSSNQAPFGNGGGIFNYTGATLTADGTTIAGNVALYGGGLNSIGTVTLTSVMMDANIALLDGGGAYAAVALTLDNTQVSRNVAAGDGGGIWFDAGILDIRGSKVVQNSALTFGGGIYQLFNVAPNRVDIRDSEITQNAVTAPNGEGGGLFSYTTEAKLVRVSVMGNSAGLNGGGIKNSDGPLTVVSSTIANNVAHGDGGGIHNDFDAVAVTASLTNSTISGNVAQGNGGGIFNDADGGPADVFFFNVTVAANDALASASDGVYLSGGTLTSRNSIVGQQVTAGADCLLALGAVVATPGAGNNLEEGVSCGFSIGGVFPGLDPLASNGGTTATHALQAGSPAIDAGNPAGCGGDPNGDGIPNIILAVDQRSVARGALCDLGAYER